MHRSYASRYYVRSRERRSAYDTMLLLFVLIVAAPHKTDSGVTLSGRNCSLPRSTVKMAMDAFDRFVPRLVEGALTSPRDTRQRPPPVNLEEQRAPVTHLESPDPSLLQRCQAAMIPRPNASRTVHRYPPCLPCLSSVGSFHFQIFDLSLHHLLSSASTRPCIIYGPSIFV